MQELFGLPMWSLLIGLSGALGLITCGVLLLAWRSPVLVKIGVRNIPRRRAQSVLIVLGLMLSATIIAASLGVGDIVNYSIEKEAVLALGHTDEVVRSRDFRVFGTDYFPYDRFLDLERAFAGDPRLDGIMPEVRDLAPVVNTRTNRTEPRMTFSGLEPGRLAGFGRTRATDGRTVELGSLGPDEVFINESAAEELEASEGDRLTIVTRRDRYEVTVNAVVEDGGIAGSRSRMLVPIEYAQRIFGHEGEINRINLSNRGDERSGAPLSEEITGEVRLLFADPEIAGQMQSFIADDRNRRALRTFVASEPAGPLRDRLLKLVDYAGSAAPPPDFRSLLADPEVAAAVALAIEQDGRQEEAIAFSNLGAAIRLLTVDQIKANGLDQSQRVSDGVTRLFLIFGSFSIIVGMLLIFLVFVLLATARRTEMGITRAVGARRRQLVQVFLFEGVLYAIGASAVGTALGVLASMLLVEFIPQSDQIGFTVVRHVEPRSVAVAFCLGLVLTVAVVAISAYRVSRLNVVAAIRGVEEEHTGGRVAGMGQRATRLVAAVTGRASGSPQERRTGSRKQRSLPLRAAVVPISRSGRVLVASWGLVQPLVRQGWPLLAAGIFLMVRGSATASALYVRVGFMVAAIGLALMLRWILERAGVLNAAGRQRVAVTFASALLLAFWSLPFQVLFEIFGDLEGGTELFVLSGVTMVTAAVAAVMYNAQVLVWIVNRSIGKIGRLAPVLKTAIAYPMAARFRTGLTLAMFALIIFTLMVIAILTNTSQLALDHMERVTGGYEITASVPVDMPIPDIEAAIAEVPGVERNDFEAIAASINVPARARQAGEADQRWQPISMRAVDDSFLESNLLEMAHYDPAYGSTAQEIWNALRGDPGLAVLNSAALPARFQQGIQVQGQRFTASGLSQEDPAPMKAFVVELTDPSGGKPPVSRIVIGVTDQLADLMGDFPQLTAEARLLADVSSKPVPLVRYDFRLAPGRDAKDIADRLETGLVDRGFEARVNDREIRELLSVNNALNQLFQSFMGLGLVVGVAALGVISFRAVVERRQAIGMMKAIGYKPRMIWLGFLLESSVVAVLGIVLGIGLGSLISWNIVNELKDQVEGLRFQIPWVNVAVIVSIAWGFSILTTLWPARQASRIYAAEALRYE